MHALWTVIGFLALLAAFSPRFFQGFARGALFLVMLGVMLFFLLVGSALVIDGTHLVR